MTLKHKVIQDFQFVTSDKKIIVLKSNSILENYTYLAKGSNEVIKIDKEVSWSTNISMGSDATVHSEYYDGANNPARAGGL
jgi:hypothetical protein